MKKKQFWKDLKEVLSYFKNSKGIIIMLFLLDALSSFLSSIFSLFLSLAITVFTKNKVLAIILLSINLSAPAFERILKLFQTKINTKMGYATTINNINFSNNILFKVRGKVEYEENGVKETMQDNVILDRAGAHFNFYKNLIGHSIGLIVQLITFVITFVAIFKTIAPEYIHLFVIILCIYIPCIIIWNIFNSMYYNKKHDILFKEFRKNSNFSRDLREIEPISRKHFEWMKEKCINSEKKNISVNYFLDKMRNFRQLFLEGTVIIAGLFIFFKYIIAKDINALELTEVMYCVSIVSLLHTICNNVSGYIASIFSYVDMVIDFKKNDEDYDQIRKVLNKDKTLKEFNDDVIKIDKFKFNYEEDEEAFSLSSNKELSFEKGKIILLQGKSGSGKSTLIKLISGNIGDIQEYKVKTMAYFDDKTELGRDTILREITLALEDKDIDYNKLNEILEGVKLKDTLTKDRLEKEHAEKLSNGERQRVLLARALYNLEDADLVVVDEPIGALDKENAKKVISFVKEYCNRDKKRIIVLCSHQYEFIEEYIDKKYSIVKTDNKSVII